MPERSNGAVSKTVAAHPAQYRPLAFRLDFCGFPGVTQGLYPGSYRLVPPSWVAIRVARSANSWRLREEASSPIQQFDSHVRGCFLGERPLETNDRSLDGGVQGLEEVAKLRRYGLAIQTADRTQDISQNPVGTATLAKNIICQCSEPEKLCWLQPTPGDNRSILVFESSERLRHGFLDAVVIGRCQWYEIHSALGKIGRRPLEAVHHSKNRLNDCALCSCCFDGL